MGMKAADAGRLPRLQPRGGGGKHTQRTVNRIRVTLLSAFVTFLLLRATIGLNRLAHSGAVVVSVSGHARVVDDIERILREIRSDSDDLDDDEDAADTASRSSTAARYHHAGASWSTDYSLGPRVTRWNAKRRRWLHANPGFPSRDARGNERVLLVTGSPAPGPCDTPAGDHYLLRATKNKADYCRLHGLEMVHDMAAARLDADLTGQWSKLPLLRRLMLAHPEVEWVWWLDSDAVITDMGFELPLDRYVTSNLVVHGHHDYLFNQRSWVAISTGSFLLRNCQWSLELLDAWATMGPKGRVRDEAGKLLTATLTGRPAIEADDQSALIHLLLTEKDWWWTDKVYIENEYHLHGLWAGLVDKYEQNMAKHHPGFGDGRWPFVTHFVGCKPCGGGRSKEDYALDRCIKGMERAFNFADNQVLRLYGFEHRSLVSAEVRRVANRSANPLEAKEEALSYLKKPKEPPAPKQKNARRKSVLVRILMKLGWRY